MYQSSDLGPVVDLLLRLPDGPERLLVLLQEEAQHKRQIELRQQAFAESAFARNYRLAFAGVLFGFIVAIVWLAGAVYLIASGHDQAGASLGIVDIVALAGVFVYGTSSRSKLSRTSAHSPQGDRQQQQPADASDNYTL